MANQSDTPSKGAKPPAMQDIEVTRDETKFPATWHVDNGKLHVSSAWGSRTETLGDGDPGRRAEELLREIVG